MVNMMPKRRQKKGVASKCQIQAKQYTTDHKGKVFFCQPEFNSKTIVTWSFHVDDFAEFCYDVILVRDFLKSLGLYLKFSE